METKDYKFQKLTPVHDAELNIYKESLDFVFKNQDIRNVAVSGAYSAGKSSVIETYKASHKEKKFLHISLAYFETADIEEEKQPDNPGAMVDENILEGKILNQLLHQIDPDKIQQTNFRIKRSVTGKKSAIEAIGISLFCMLLLYTLKFGAWKGFLEGFPTLKPYLAWTTHPIMLFAACGIMGGLLIWFAYSVIQLQKNRNLFRRVNVKGNEIEIFEQSNDSYFDKYLNEVLYLFDNSDTDVVVFEDMDRYNTNQIFQRLREVNMLVNNRRMREGKAVLRFFYLLRDDIFVSKDRTKFFDFIIPIVPILDGSNSYDKFIEHFKKGGIFQLFEENFLQGISLYVDDMRILKNVYNEFVIYNARIGTTEQNANKLLALIVYKNIFPRDFSDLQLNRGFVYSLFSSKDRFIDEKKSDLLKKIEEKKELIVKINNEVLASEEELNQLYSRSPYVDSWKNLLEKYRKIKESRIENLRIRDEDGIEKIKEEINQIEKQIAKLEELKLSEIIDRDNIDQIFKTDSVNEIGKVNEYREIKGSDYFDLLKYLIREGFIDETYPDYMTYFYENSISRIDKIFLRSVSDQKAKDYGYELRNPKLVAKRLRMADYENQETLNFDLLCYLLQNRFTYSEELRRLIQQIKEAGYYDFVIRYIETSRETDKFIQIVNQLWPEYFGTILTESEYTCEQKKLIAVLSLYYSSKEEIAKVNEEGVLSDFISETPDFLQIKNPKLDVIIDKLQYLDIHFKYLDYGVSNLDLWEKVYANNLYELNWEMIESILENKYKIGKSDEYYTKTLTLIFSKPEEALALHVKADINGYYERILFNCGDEIADNAEVVKYILNHNTLEVKYKQNYIERLTTKLSSIEEIEDTVLWPQILVNENLDYSEWNVLQYFFGIGKKYDESLIQFINKFATHFTIQSKAIEEEFGVDSPPIFFSNTVKCNQMSNDKYKMILQSQNRYFNSFEIEGINEGKIDILIDLNIIRMNSDVLFFMREHYPDHVIHLIEKNPNAYVDAITDESFLLDELLQVLKTGIESTYKIELLKFTDEPVAIQEVQYEDVVETYILEHNFDRDDLEYVAQKYNSLAETSKATVEHLMREYVSYIVDHGFAVTYTLLIKLLRDSTITVDMRWEILSFSIIGLEMMQCRECLELLEDDNYCSLFEGKRPKFEISEVSKRILEAFQQKRWISKYEEEGDFYRAIGRKPRMQNELPTELL